MKSMFFGYNLTVRFAALAAAFSLDSGPATAQNLATEAKETMRPSPPPSSPTPVSTDGHPDLTGRCWAYRGVNLDVRQVGTTTVNLQPTSRAPESEDPENNLSVNTRIYDSVAARRANPDKPSYKPELIPKVERLDRLQGQLGTAN